MSRQREQRLQAIYDAFDARNYKGAIKLSNAAVQKYPDQPVFKTLKAVALERTGKSAEALQLVDEVLTLAPPDDHVLNMLLLVLKPAKRAADLQHAYEVACSKDPNNAELLQGLFGCHVRSFNFQSQQQIAMKLNKTHPNELYQWWVITSLALQAHKAAANAAIAASTSSQALSTTHKPSGASVTPGAAVSGGASPAPGGPSPTPVSGGLGADKLLQLTEAMAGRLLSKHSGCCPPSWESAMLYLGLLQVQGKYDAALAALRGPLFRSFSLPAERREAEAALLLAKGDTAAAAANYEQALQQQPDDWALLLLYLDCLLPSTACSMPAISSNAVAQMVTGIEASTTAGTAVGGLQTHLARLSTDGATTSVEDQIARAKAFILGLPTTAPADSSSVDSSSSDHLETQPGTQTLHTTGHLITGESLASNGEQNNQAEMGDNNDNDNTDETENDDNSGSDSSHSGSKQPRRLPLLRGPALALVELTKRRLLLGHASQQELANAMLEYHDKLGHLVSCAMDVATYLSLLSNESRTALAQHFEELADQAAAEFAAQQHQQQNESKSSSSKAMINLLRRQMAARQIQADLGGPMFATAAAAQQHAQQLLQLYKSYLPFYEGLDERERGPADELLWLAAAALMQAAAAQQQQQSNQTLDNSSSSDHGPDQITDHRSHPISFMLQAILALEAAAASRPYCAPVRLGLTGLHGLLGNPKTATDHFFMLDVKHIQHDTLSSHHLLPLLLGLGVTEGCEEVLEATLRLFDDHVNGDAGESLMQAYERGTFTKVLEFVCFKERLQRSHNYILSRAEYAILTINTAAATSADAAASAARTAAAGLPITLLDSLDWQGMRFNDDLTTRVPWLLPIPGPRHLQLLLWWEQQQQQGQVSSSSSRGEQQLWWKQVSAAEADLPTAAQYRSALKAAAQQRWLLPHLIAAATRPVSGSSSSSDGSNSDAADQFQQLLQRYMGSGNVESLQEELQQYFGDQPGQQQQQGCRVAVSRQLQLLDAALFALAQPVQVLLATAADEAASADSLASVCTSISSSASLLMSGLKQLQQQVCEQLAPDAAYLGSLLPGHALSAAVLLVSGSCTWTAVCLEAWSKSVKQIRNKRKAKKTPASAAPVLQAEAAQQAMEYLAAVQAALTSCLQGIATSCNGILANKEADVAGMLLAQYDPSSNPDVQVLVAYEQRASVQNVLHDAVKAQRQVLEQVVTDADKLGKRAQHVSW